MKNMLIVDDSAFMRKYLKDTLVSVGDIYLNHEVEYFEADSKNSAISQLNQYKMDVILLDIVMKNSILEGFEMIDNIKNSFDTNKIIIFSSTNQFFLLKKCQQLGVQHYLQKPVDRDILINKINQCLAD